MSRNNPSKNRCYVGVFTATAFFPGAVGLQNLTPRANSPSGNCSPKFGVRPGRGRLVPGWVRQSTRPGDEPSHAARISANAFRVLPARPLPYGTTERPVVRQSQRDCVLQPSKPSPRGYPGLGSVRFSTPTGLCPRSATGPQPRWGWPTPPAFPRVARGSQPWALGRNPFGIQLGSFRKAWGQILAALDSAVAPETGARGRDYDAGLPMQ